MRSTTQQLRRTRRRPLRLAPGVKPPILIAKIDREWTDLTTADDLRTGTLRRYQLSSDQGRNRPGIVLILRRDTGWSAYDLNQFRVTYLNSDYARIILADPSVLDMEQVL